jgi:prepilin-type N-terminal cleavage/methylation domain-containing protein
MLQSHTHQKKGFTLIEMMIVIAIIMTLLGLVFFPYSYYMQRAYVENTVDTLSQGWILAHKDIRNGKLYGTGTTAHKVLVFQKGSEEVRQYLLSGTTLPNLNTIDSDTSVKVENPIRFESNTEILGFSGATLDTADIV